MCVPSGFGFAEEEHAARIAAARELRRQQAGLARRPASVPRVRPTPRSKLAALLREPVFWTGVAELAGLLLTLLLAR